MKCRDKIKKAACEKDGISTKKVILIVLAVAGGIAAVAGAVYGLYRLFAPDYLEDFDDDLEEDFEDDFFDEDDD